MAKHTTKTLWVTGLVTSGIGLLVGYMAMKSTCDLVQTGIVANRHPRSNPHHPMAVAPPVQHWNQ